MTKKLLILTTGGTIASVKTPHGLIPALTSEELLSYLPEIGSDFLLKTKAVCNLDSTDITPEHWLLLAGSIREEYHNYDGFVICHGTDTMAYTAAALSLSLIHIFPIHRPLIPAAWPQGFPAESQPCPAA